MKTEDIRKMGQAYLQVLQKVTFTEKAMDPVDPKELKGKHKDRKDKDIDNDGDVDKSDEYLHNRRKTISKAIKKDKNNGSTDEVETQEGKQVDEISKDLAGRYIKKANINTADAADQNASKGRGDKSSIGKVMKRFKGVGQAVDKLTGKAKVPATESVEIDEANDTTHVEPAPNKFDRKVVNAHKKAAAYHTALANKHSTASQNAKHEGESRGSAAHSNSAAHHVRTAKAHLEAAKAHEGAKYNEAHKLKSSSIASKKANSMSQDAHAHSKQTNVDHSIWMDESVQEATVTVDHDTISRGTTNTNAKKFNINVKHNHDGPGTVLATGEKENMKKYLTRHYGSSKEAKSEHPDVFKESAGTAQHKPDPKTTDTWEKQLSTRKGEKDFVDQHKSEVDPAADVNKVLDLDFKTFKAMTKKSPARSADQKKGDTQIVKGGTPVKGQ